MPLPKSTTDMENPQMYRFAPATLRATHELRAIRIAHENEGLPVPRDILTELEKRVSSKVVSGLR